VHCFRDDSDTGQPMNYDEKTKEWVCPVCAERYNRDEYKDANDRDVVSDYADDLNMIRNLAGAFNDE